MTKPKFREDLTCPACLLDNAVGLAHPDTGTKIGWCDCGYTWTELGERVKKIKNWGKY